MSEPAIPVVERPPVRILRAKLQIAKHKLAYMEWWGQHVADFKGNLQQTDIRQTMRDLGVAQQKVVIAEARLEQAVMDERSPATPEP